jgi:hypothetical protein
MALRRYHLKWCNKSQTVRGVSISSSSLLPCIDTVMRIVFFLQGAGRQAGAARRGEALGVVGGPTAGVGMEGSTLQLPANLSLAQQRISPDRRNHNAWTVLG